MIESNDNAQVRAPWRVRCDRGTRFVSDHLQLIISALLIANWLLARQVFLPDLQDTPEWTAAGLDRVVELVDWVMPAAFLLTFLNWHWRRTRPQ